MALDLDRIPELVRCSRELCRTCRELMAGAELLISETKSILDQQKRVSLTPATQRLNIGKGEERAASSGP